MKIQLLYFPGCPNVQAARNVLEKAMLETSVSLLELREINVQAPDCPAHLKNWPSPSILVNGKDIEGQSPKAGAACRVYKNGIAPALGEIVNAITNAKDKKNAHD